MVYNHKDHQAGPLMPWAVPWRSMRTTPWTAARDCLVTHPVTMAPEAFKNKAASHQPVVSHASMSHQS